MINYTKNYIEQYHKREVIPAWEEGANAFSKGLSLKDNPYDTKSANYISWKTAFKEAKKSHKRTFVK